MKKYTAAICLITSLLFLSSCDVFLNPTSDDNSNTEKTSQKESDKESDKTQTFEYTAENNVPARKTPFDKKLCYEKINALELSDGDWTLNDIYISEDVADTKIILGGTAAQNKITWKSAVTKLDMSATTEASTESQQASSESIDFADTFKEIKPYIFGENSDYVTFSNGYLTDDDEVVYIANIQLDKIETICKIENKISHSEIMTNPNHTKYVIPYTDDDSGFIYLYKNANLNDKETVPENNETETTPPAETPETPETPVDTPAETSTTTPADTPADTSTTSPEESQQQPVGLQQQYTSENNISSVEPPFDTSLCNIVHSSLEFSNGNWTVVDSTVSGTYIRKVISKVNYENGNYNCTSVVIKIDFPRNGETEATVNYEQLAEACIQNMNSVSNLLTFSHGYLTDRNIVLIIEGDPQIFENVYLVKLNQVSSDKIISNAAKTKYMICYNQTYQQTIYISKDGDNTATTLNFDDCTTDCTKDDFSMADGSWTGYTVEFQAGAKLEEIDLFTVTNSSFSITNSYIKCTYPLAAIGATPGAPENFLTSSDSEKISWVKSTPQTPPDVTVYIEGDNIVLSYLETDTKDGSSITLFTGHSTAIKTNSDKSKYVISIYLNDDGKIITGTKYISKN